jgi:hypothetical protein
MSLDRKIISEIERYHRINKYIMEQEVDAPPPPTAPESEVLPSEDQAALPAPEAQPEVIDVEQDDEVTKVDNSGKTEEDKTEESSTEELDITDLVKSQEEIQNKQEEYFQNLFSQISNLESKLKEMDSIVGKLNAIENKIEKYREKTPQEKLELRSYDSYPFNQKLSDFFEDKKEEMEKTGKKDYVLTSDQVTDIRDSDIRDSFVPSQENIKF